MKMEDFKQKIKERLDEVSDKENGTIDYASFLKLAKETFADDIRKLDEELAEIYGNGDDNGE
jgi:hypothetical protein